MEYYKSVQMLLRYTTALAAAVMKAVGSIITKRISSLNATKEVKEMVF